MNGHPVWWLLGLAALACGGTTRNHERETPSGGSGGQAPSSGGSGSSGKPDAGGSSSGATSHAGSSAVPTPSGGTNAAGGAGGTGFGQPTAGAAPSEDPSNLDCNQPYFGPMAGARSDGPEPLAIGTCQDIPDEVLLARYADFKARVPTGFFYDPATQIEIWDAGCSSNVGEAVAHASLDGIPSGMHQSDWFYELVYCQEGTRRLFRSLRCDYFDGSTLSAPSPERLLFLSSLLWWTQNYNVSGAAQLGYSVMVGNATDWVEVCTLRSTRGDFGLCDELTLESTRHLVRAGGQVELGQPTLVRTLKGRCH